MKTTKKDYVEVVYNEADKPFTTYPKKLATYLSSRFDIKKDWNILVHDDLLATGGTACATAELIQMLGAKVAGFAFIVSLDFLHGKEKLKQYSDQIISLKDY